MPGGSRRNMTITQEWIPYLRGLLEYDLEHTDLDDNEFRMVEGLVKKLNVNKTIMIKVGPKILVFLREAIQDDLALTDLSPGEVRVANALLKKIIGTISAFKRFGEMDDRDE